MPNFTSLRTLRALRAVTLAAILGVSSTASAVETVERIVAIVDDDIVLATEVGSRFDAVIQRLAAQGQSEVPHDIVWKQILETLIQERIQIQEAMRRDIDVDDETLTARVAEYAAQAGMSLDEFIAQFEASGESYPALRDEIRQQMMIERVQRNAVNRRVYVTEQDIDELLASPFFQELISDEFRLGHILLQVEPGAPAEDLEAAWATADDIIRELGEGADFAALALKHSAAPTSTEGGDLGWRKPGRIPGIFAEVAVALEIGETAEPLQNASGIHIVKLIDKRGASQQRAEQTQVRHILLTPSAIRSDEETRAAMEELRARLVDGEDFAELAKEHSEDPGTALAGGDLGWTSGDMLDPDFVSAMNATAVDEISPPFRSSFGWHILEVQGRRQQDVSDETRREYAFRILHQRRFEQRLDEWLNEVRDDAFVEERMDYEEFARWARVGDGPGS